MPVTGGKELSRLFREAGPALRRRVAEAVEEGAERVLSDMKAAVPRDTGALASALTYEIEEGGLAARIGLPRDGLLRDYFYARFIEFGTKGGEVRYRRISSDVARGASRRARKREREAGLIRFHTMRVPARPARPFMQTAIDLNRAELMEMLEQAARRAIREAAR